jgi:hypothetical protein
MYMRLSAVGGEGVVMGTAGRGVAAVLILFLPAAGRCSFSDQAEKEGKNVL